MSKGFSGYNFSTNKSKNGGVLTEAYFNEQLEAMHNQPEWTGEPRIILTATQLTQLKKKYPKMFKRNYKCSWQEMADAIFDVKTNPNLIERSSNGS